MEIILVIAFFVLGFIIDYIASGKRVNGKGIIPSLKFNLGKFKFHIHHWVGLLLLILIFLLINYQNYYLYSFLIGMIIRSLSVPDSFRIITKI